MTLDIITSGAGQPLPPPTVDVYRCPRGCRFHVAPGGPVPKLCWLHGEAVTVERRAATAQSGRGDGKAT